MPPMGDASSSSPAPVPAPDASAMPESPESETPMDDMGSNEAGGSGKAQEITDIANEISEKDQETLLAYARSLKDTSEEAAETAPGSDPAMSGNMGGGAPMPPAGGGDLGAGAMNESVVFTKKQIRTINEGFGGMNDELDRDFELGHTTKLKSDKNKPVSPFDPPRKNRK